jgi:RNA polymerase sigma factor for flagellar operon FliA
VRYIAERLLQTLPKSIELDDLISAGNFGLMDAIRGFDPYRGIKFKTYCSTRVRGAILDQLRSQDWVPRLVRLKASRIDRALQRLTAEYGREPTHAELARVLEMEHGDLVQEIQESRAKTMFSLSEKWEDDDGSVEKVEILEDKGSIDPVNELNRRDLMGFITRALTHKERFIIEQYYQYGHTMREIGEMLALTESRVCQIHTKAILRLKGKIDRHEGKSSIGQITRQIRSRQDVEAESETVPSALTRRRPLEPVNVMACLTLCQIASCLSWMAKSGSPWPGLTL